MNTKRLISHATTSQCSQVLKYLQDGNTLTQLQALYKFECFRLPARIDQLRQEGHDIKTKMIKLASGKRVAEYYMEIEK